MKIGSNVKILECHALPQLVGMKGVVVEITPGVRWPISVKLNQPVIIKGAVPGVGMVIGSTDGPFDFREPELEEEGNGASEQQKETVKTAVPDYVLAAFSEGPEAPKTQAS